MDINTIKVKRNMNHPLSECRRTEQIGLHSWPELLSFLMLMHSEIIDGAIQELFTKTAVDIKMKKSQLVV